MIILGECIASWGDPNEALCKQVGSSVKGQYNGRKPFKFCYDFTG